MLMWTNPGAYTHIKKQAASHQVRPHHFPPQYHRTAPHSHIATDKESHTPQIRTTLPHTTALPQDFSLLGPLPSAPASYSLLFRQIQLASRQSPEMRLGHQHTLLLKIIHAIIASMWTSTKLMATAAIFLLGMSIQSYDHTAFCYVLFMHGFIISLIHALLFQKGMRSGR